MELRADMEEPTLALFMPSAYEDAQGLQRATQEQELRNTCSQRCCAQEPSRNSSHVRGYQLEFGQEFREDIRPEISEHFECLSTCTWEGDSGKNHSASHQMARKTLSPCQAAEGRLWTDGSDFNLVLNTRSSSQQTATVVAVSGRLSWFPKQCEPRVLWIHWKWLDDHLTLNCLPAFAEQLRERRWRRWVHPGPDGSYVTPEWPCSDKQMFAQMYQKI